MKAEARRRMNNLICWFKAEVLSCMEIQELLMKNKITPMIDGYEAEVIWDAQGSPETLRELWYDVYDERVTPYKDEPFSVKDGEDSEEWVKQTVEKHPDITMGESSTEDIERLVKCGVKNITYTSYGWHLFRLFNKWNIRMPLTSQLRTWKYLEKKYGKWIERNNVTLSSYYESKFNFVWIMLDQTRHWRKLLEWAIQYQKTIGIAVPDKRKSDTEWVYNRLTKFIKVYKQLEEEKK